MAQNIVELGYNWKEFLGEGKKVIGSMEEIFSYAKRMEETKFSFSGMNVGLQEFKKANEQLKEVISQLNKISNQYTETQKKQTQTTKESSAAALNEAKAATEVSKQKLNQTKAETEALRSKKLLNQESEKAQRIANGDKKLIKDAANEYFQLNKALQDAELRYKNLALTQGFSNDQTKVALKEALAIRNVLDNVDVGLRNHQRNVGNYASGYNGLNMSIQQILREAPSAAISLNTFFLAISNNLPMFFDELAKAKKVIEETNKAIRAGAAAARVQAEASAFLAGATKEAAIAQGLLAEKVELANLQQTKAPSVLKQIAGSLFSVNTLLTVSVLALTLFGGKIVEWVGSLMKSEQAVKSLHSANKELVDVFKTASESAQREIVNLRVLEQVATDVNKPMAVRLQAVKDMKELYPKMLENLSNEAILNSQAAVQINAVANALLKKAFYEAAANKATEKASKNIDLKLRENYLMKEQNRVQNEALQLQAKLAAPGNAGAARELARYLEQKETHLKNINGLLNKNTTEQKFNGDMIQYFTKLAAENFETVKKLEIDPKGKKEKDIKTIGDAVADLRKELETIQNKFNISQLTFTEADVERAKAYSKAFNDIFDRGGNATTPIVQQLLIEFDPISKRILDIEIHDLFTKLGGTITPDGIEVPVEYKPVIPDGSSFAEGEAAFYDAISQRQLTILATQQANEHAALIKRKLSREEYEKELLLLTAKYGQKTYEEQVKWLEREIELLSPGTKAREDAEKKLADIKLSYLNKLSEVEVQNLTKLKDGYKELGNAIIGVFEEMILSGYDREIEAIDELQKRKDEYYAKEIDNIQRSTLTEQDKANRLTVLRAEQDAQRILSENRQEEIEKRRAKTQRIIQAVVIGGEAAQKVFTLASMALQAKAQAAVLASNPLTVAYAPVALASAASISALIPVTLGIAAAQIGKLAISKYAEGTGPEGHDGKSLALYGEAGPEVVEEPGKKPYVVDRPHLGVLPKHTHITPISDAYFSEISNTAFNKQLGYTLKLKSGNSDSDYLMRELITEVRKGNSNKKGNSVKVVYDPDFKVWVDKNVRGK